MLHPKRIERLWAACPELVPAWLTIKERRFFKLNEIVVPDSVAHALIRDKIVGWFVDRSHFEQGDKFALSRVRHRHMLGAANEYRVEADRQNGFAVMLFNFTDAIVRAAEFELGLPEWKE